MYRKTWMEINLDAIAENVRSIHKKCGKKFIAVLKANAYGSGDRQVAQTVLEAGADMIAVSSLEEAMILRNEGFQAPLFILGDTDPKDCSILIQENIATTAYSMHWVKEVLQQPCSGLKVHIKVDTGMNRIGFHEFAEIQEAVTLLKNAGCIVDGIFTHFACADNNPEMTQKQYERFAQVVKQLDTPFQWIHCDNSDATTNFIDPVSNACRVGISLYGINTFDKSLKQALALYTTIFMVKTVPSGQTIGYGATYQTKQDEIIATVPIGYADGLVRANQGRKVYVDGQYATIVGRVCMDQCMLKLSEQKPEGTIVEIFGPHISLETMAEELHTIPYEIICLLNSRVTHVYLKNGKQLKEENVRLENSHE